MKRTAKLLLFASALSIGAAAIALTPYALSSFARYEAGKQSYAFEGNASCNRFLPSVPGSGIGRSHTKLGNEIRWAYDNASSTQETWAILLPGSRISNLDPLHGLEKISIALRNENASFFLRYGGGKEMVESRLFSASSEKKTIDFDFLGKAPNHLEIVAKEETQIASISLVYSCGDQYVDFDLSSNDALRGEVRGGGRKRLGEQTTITAAPRLGMKFDGWYENGSLVSEEASYTLPVEKARSFEARFSGEIALHGSYSYGRYPQRVATAEEASTLEQCATEKDGTYRHGNDVFLRLEANPRGSNPKTFDDGSAIKKGESYFFKLEPIAWKVLSKETDGSVLLLTEKVLDLSSYFPSENDRQIEGQTIAPNHYGHSSLRSYLNGYDGTAHGVEDFQGKGFLDRAFSPEEKGRILRSVVDNSAETTWYPSNPFACANTEDFLFPLSYVDFENEDYGFSANDPIKRRALGSDFANASGLGMEVDWRTANYWTRSPSPSFGTQTSHVMMNGVLGFAQPDFAHYGIRPAMKLHFR